MINCCFLICDVALTAQIEVGLIFHLQIISQH